MRIREAQIHANELATAFNERYDRPSTLSFYFIDLIQELGKVAEVIRTEELSSKKPEENLENRLVDLLYDVLMIANLSKIDLETTFIKRMEQFQTKFLRK